MSDQVLKLIPADKNFLPDKEAAEKARALLEDFFPDGEQADIEFSASIRFIDGGQSLERITCPLCNKSTEINPFQKNDVGTAWWYELDETLSGNPDLNALQVKCHVADNLAKLKTLIFQVQQVFQSLSFVYGIHILKMAYRKSSC